MGKTTKIYTLNLEIYPRQVWVMIDPTVKDINKYFGTRTNGDIYLSDTAFATTISLYRKSTKRMGELIRINKANGMTCGAIAHESLHAAIDICHDLGIHPTYEDQEPLAYLTQLIANFVDKVLKEVKK